MPDPASIVLTVTAVFVIAFMKGGFGGDFAILGIPILSLALDPIAAGAFLAPRFVVMDLAALRYWKPTTWSKPDLTPILHGLVIGIAAGAILLQMLHVGAVATLMGITTLAF